MAEQNKLSPQEMLFCQVIASDPNRNLTEAYSTAYPECKSRAAACANAHRLLKRDRVRQYLDSLDRKTIEIAEEKFAITTERVTQEKSRVAFFDPRKLFHQTGELKKIHELDDDTAAALTSFKVLIKPGKDGDDAPVCMVAEVSWNNKVAILDQLSKQLGQYERDNDQKTKGLAELLSSVDGKTRGLPHDDGEDE